MLNINDNLTAAKMLREYFEGGLDCEERHALLSYLSAEAASLDDEIRADAEVFMIIESGGPGQNELQAPADLRSRLTLAVDLAGQTSRHKKRLRSLKTLIPAAACAAVIALIFTVGGNVGHDPVPHSPSRTYASAQAQPTHRISINASDINRFARHATSTGTGCDTSTGTEITAEAVTLLARNLASAEDNLSQVSRNINKIKTRINNILK